MTEPRSSLYRGHRYPFEINAEAVWLYFRFPLSFPMIEDMLAYRGIFVTHKTVYEWAEKFGQAYASNIRRRTPRHGDKCWDGRSSNGIEMCQSELLTISSEGAVRGSDYPYWHGYVSAPGDWQGVGGESPPR